MVFKLLIESHCVGVGIYGTIVFKPLLPISKWGFFYFARCVGISQLVLNFFQSKLFKRVSVDLVCPWWEVSSGSSYITIFW